MQRAHFLRAIEVRPGGDEGEISVRRSCAASLCTEIKTGEGQRGWPFAYGGKCGKRNPNPLFHSLSLRFSFLSYRKRSLSAKVIRLTSAQLLFSSQRTNKQEATTREKQKKVARLAAAIGQRNNNVHPIRLDRTTVSVSASLSLSVSRSRLSGARRGSAYSCSRPCSQTILARAVPPPCLAKTHNRSRALGENHSSKETFRKPKSTRKIVCVAIRLAEAIFSEPFLRFSASGDHLSGQVGVFPFFRCQFSIVRFRVSAFSVDAFSCGSRSRVQLLFV